MSTGLSNSTLISESSLHLAEPEVVVVNVSVSGSRLGGAAIAAEWHSRFLAKQCLVELWRMWDADSSSQIDSLQVRNFVSTPRFGALGKSLPRRAKALVLQSKILSQLLELKPKIVHLQNPGPALEFERIARQCQENGIKVVASTHGFYEVFNPNFSWTWYENYGWKQWLTKPIQRSFPYIDAFLSGYPDERSLLLENGVSADKIHLVPNGINPLFETPPTLEEQQQTLEKFDLSPAEPTLLFIGNHTANKGLDTVVEIAAQLNRPATVVIGGKLLTPDEPQHWQAKIPKDSPVKLLFTDYLSNIEQRVLYNFATLLLFPSMADTLPLTILEAMACSLPVIAYDTGGIAYQLAEGAGCVVPQGNSAQFLTNVKALLDNPTQRQAIAVAARHRQQQLFSWSLAAQTTIDIYQDLLNLD